MKELLERLEDRFTVTESDVERDNLAFITLPSKEVVQAATHLRDIEGFGHLVMISAVDYIERGIFQLTYILHNYDKHSDIGVRTEIDRRNPVMDSIHHLWAAARVYQQELREMFGIDFPGSPRVDEPMILEGWDNIPPMRKDFDTKKYAEETYFPREGRVTYDPARAMEEKNYPLEARVKKRIQKLLREGKDED
ncbi:MAG: NADH-quinone oxidoreductase subunit C [Candidatus Latescibacteria bacterium 4484_7]|nr:MAG: NADH-quinone oxidoreductase subunit C [Candidatus Latescibacteria bacterium 4484_7]